MPTQTRLPILKPGQPVPAAHYAEVTESRNALRSAAGDGRYIAVSLQGGALGVRWIGGPLIRPPVTFLARITSVALQSGHAARWDYGFEEVAWTAPGVVATVDGGRSGTAINLRELEHVADPGSGHWYVWGVDVYGDDYPAGFAPRPVGGGGTSGTLKTSPIVRITQATANGTTTFYTFEAMGSHDGTCDA
jgi:hypothetical protein